MGAMAPLKFKIALPVSLNSIMAELELNAKLDEYLAKEEKTGTKILNSLATEI